MVVGAQTSLSFCVSFFLVCAGVLLSGNMLSLRETAAVGISCSRNSRPLCMYANSRPVCMRTGNAESQKRSAKGSNFRRQDLPLNKFPILDDRDGPLISYYSMKPTLLYFYSTFIRHVSKFQHHQVGLAHRQTS